MRLTIAFLVLSTVFASCNKDKTAPCEPEITLNHSNDTIFPSDYLMTYPGSWWEYDTGFIDSCNLWEAVPIRNTTTTGECVFIDEDSWILPEGLIYSAHNIGFDQSIITIGD